MKSIGGTIFFLAVGSVVLHFLNMEFMLLSWVDNWGATTGWVIRGALAVLGGVMWLAGNRDGE
jgi:hypothetical protein